jgi:hypothetical protein
VIRAASTLTEVAFTVCTALHRTGYTVVMTGGSAATFYAPRAYLSGDIDFVITLKGAGGEDALARLGYHRKGDYYVHSSSRFSLEFPPGPLAIGDDFVDSWKTFHRKRQLLHVLSPTDACRDRLASFLFWNDFRGLQQALDVCQAQRRKVDLDVVRTWCLRERQAEKFQLFKQRLEALLLTKAMRQKRNKTRRR